MAGWRTGGGHASCNACPGRSRPAAGVGAGQVPAAAASSGMLVTVTGTTTVVAALSPHGDVGGASVMGHPTTAASGKFGGDGLGAGAAGTGAATSALLTLSVVSWRPKPG